MRLTDIPPPSSPIREMNQLTGDLAKQGLKTFNLTLGAPKHAAPETVTQVGLNYDTLRSSQKLPGSYSHFFGDVGAREKVANALNDRYSTPHTEWNSDNIALTNGTNGGLAAAIRTLTEPGETVVTHWPNFPTYQAMIKDAGEGRSLLLFDIEADGSVNPEALQHTLTQLADVEQVTPSSLKTTFIFTNPGNPTGYAHSAEQMQAICATLDQFPNVNVISDEVYREMVFPPQAPMSLDQFASESLQNRIVSIDSISKVESLCDERGGYLRARDSAAAKQIGLTHFIRDTHNNVAAQHMLAEAMEKRPTYAPEIAQYYADRVNHFTDRLASIGLVPEAYRPNAGFYLLCDFSSLRGKTLNPAAANHLSKTDLAKIDDARSAAIDLAYSTGVVGIPWEDPRGAGEAGTKPLYVRFAPTSNIETLEQAADQIEAYVKSAQTS